MELLSKSVNGDYITSRDVNMGWGGGLLDLNKNLSFLTEICREGLYEYIPVVFGWMIIKISEP